jgi:hypothetical protein
VAGAAAALNGLCRSSARLQVSKTRGIVPALVSALGAGAPAHAAQSLEALSSKVDGMLMQVADTPGALQALVGALGRADSAYHATWVLGNIAAAGADARARIAEAPGMLPALVAALRGAHADDAAESAARALRKLTAAHDEKAHIKKVAQADGMLPAVVAALGKPRSAASAAAVLHSVSLLPGAPPCAVGETAGALRGLVAALGSPDAAFDAVRALENITRAAPRLQPQIAAVPGVLPALAALLATPRDGVIAAAILTRLGGGDDAHKRAIASAHGLIAAAVAAMETDDARGRGAAMVLNTIVPVASGRIADTHGALAALAAATWWVGKPKNTSNVAMAIVEKMAASQEPGVVPKIARAEGMLGALVAALGRAHTVAAAARVLAVIADDADMAAAAAAAVAAALRQAPA